MNFFAAGFDELERELQRWGCRFHVWLRGRELTKAEIELGSLGWQQADDFPPEIEEQMRTIHAFEREQVELTNQSADIQWNIVELKKQLDEANANFRSRIIEWQIASRPYEESIAALESQIEEKNQSIQRFDGAIARLDAARESLAGQLHALLAVENPTLEIREQTIAIGDKRTAFDNEKEDLMRSRMRVSGELKTITDGIEAANGQIEEINQTIRRAREEFGTWEKERLAHIADLQAQKERASKGMRIIDKKKSPAYRAIGRCLADAGIAPMNQPHALDQVLALREDIAMLHQKIEALLAQSLQAAPPSMAKFYGILLLLIVVTIIVIAILLKLLVHSH